MLMMLLPPNMYSYFSVRLKTGKEYYEREGVDWDWLVRSGDVHKIAELRLHCPNGVTRTLTIDEPGTAFQLKRASVMQGFGHMRTAHIIGKITNRETGECVCHGWDYFAGLFENY